MTKARLAAVAAAALLALFVPAPAAGQDIPPTTPVNPPGAVPEGFVLIKTISLAGNGGWRDAGLKVKPGDEIYFEAEGSICVQRGNPVATCGPEGLSLRTMQQPLPDRNMGCLIGMVVFRTDVTEDKETKEKTEKRFGAKFAIGRGGLIAMPEEGALWLGVNENLTGDNEGAFTVLIYGKPPA
jgi:hypothetical protein